MGSMSIWHWLVVLLLLAQIIPIVKILSKAGFSGWWSIIGFLPLVNILGVWIFAFTKWPNVAELRKS